MFSCSFFVRPKKEPKKGRRKRQPQPVCPPATQGHKGATKQAEVRTVSGLPTHIALLVLLIICFPIFYKTSN